MKKTVICSIPMNANTQKTIYQSSDESIAVSQRPVVFPVTAFLENSKTTDNYSFILLAKADEYSCFETNIDALKEELQQAIPNSIVDFKVLVSDFKQTKDVHSKLMAQIIENIENDSHVIVDMTYGPKDIPIIIFAALNFAEKFLGCEIENILYGKADFSGGKVLNTSICDMSPLYYLNSVTNTINCDSPEKAKSMLKTLISL